MELVKDTPMEAAWHVWRPRPSQASLTVVVKGTFTLVPDGSCTLADAQALPTGDLHHDDDVERSLRYASDLEPLKPRGECMVIGSFHAPEGRAVPQSKVAFQIGSVKKQLAVFGDRVWHLGRASAPRAIDKLTLSWEHAFGGRGVGDNPVGRGVTAVDVEGQSRVRLPNLEDPMSLVSSREARPKPVGFGPIARTWASRMRHAGTYDAKWQKSRYPFFPEDLDWRFFNAAPADQQVDDFWRGDEEIVLRHLHPQHAILRTQLPGLRAHAFLMRSAGFVDVGLSLDTINVDADAGLAYCIWRGVTEVAREDLADIVHLYVTHQERNDRMRMEGFRARYQQKLDAMAEEEQAAEQEPSPTASVAMRLDMLEAMVDPHAPGAKWAHLDQSETLGGDQSAMQNALQEAIARKSSKLRRLRPVFEDALGLGTPASTERELGPEERLELEMQLALGDLLEKEEDPRRTEVRAAIDAGESLAGRDLSGIDLSGLELRDVDLRNAILTRANLNEARFSNVRLDGANLTKAELSGASFESCSLIGTDLTNVRAHRIRMHECDLTDATSKDSFLRDARFSSTRFLRAELCESDLSSCEFRACTLDQADLSACVLENTVMRDSSLVDAWLEGGVKARKLNLDGCEAPLLRASEEGDFEEASFRKTVLDGARFGKAKLRKANFSLARLSRADFSEAQLPEAVLMGCDLRMACFDRATLVKASLLKSNLMQARLPDANLRFADLRGANLFQAELLNAKLEDARLELANLGGTRQA